MLASFGFTERSLISANSVLPIAYYLLKRGLPTSYDSGSKYTSDRVAVRQWLLKALLRGVFGSMGDTVLSNMRAIIKSSHEGFPSEALADKIRFTEEDIDYILATRYGQKQVFLVLSLLYPWVDYRNAFHLDHIHPQTMFSGKKLKQAHLPEQDIEFCLAHYDELPNLQILANIPNIEKSNQPFDKWLADTYKGKKYRAQFCGRQFIPDTDLHLANFREFVERRAELMRDEFVKVLQAASADECPSRIETV